MRAVRVLFVMFLALAAACSSSTDDSTALVAPGTYHATVFHVTPPGGSEIDVLAAGGSMTITFAANNAISGSLSVPASVAGTALNANMAGTVVAGTGFAQFTFNQTADTFVRDLTWTASTGVLAAGQTVAGAHYGITLTKQ